MSRKVYDPYLGWEISYNQNRVDKGKQWLGRRGTRRLYCDRFATLCNLIDQIEATQARLREAGRLRQKGVDAV